jgi:hypothetical protein
MLRSIAYRAKNTHPVTMPLTSLLTSLQDASTKVLFGSDSGTDKTSFYDLVDKDMQGNEVKMESFKGDVLCVVNVASK